MPVIVNVEDSSKSTLNLLVVVSETTDSTGGDVDILSLPLVATLRQIGHQVTLLYVRTRSRSRIFLARQAARLREAGLVMIPVIPDSERVPADPRTVSYRVYHWLKLNQHCFDIAYFSDRRGPGYFSLVAKRLGLAFDTLPLVTHMAGPTSWVCETTFSLPDSIDDVDCDFMEKECVRLSDWVICESTGLHEWMRAHKWRFPDRVSVLPGVSARPVKREASIGSFVPCTELVFLGRLDLAMGLRLFCDAIGLVDKKELSGVRKITFIGKTGEKKRIDSAGFIAKRARQWGIPYRLLTHLDGHRTISYLGKPGRVAVVIPLMDSASDMISACLHNSVPFISTRVGGVPGLVHQDDHVRVLCSPYPAAVATQLGRVLREGTAVVRPADDPSDTLGRWVSLQDAVKQVPDRVSVQHRSPLVTVCVVHHDRPQLLSQALDSLRAQTYQNFEVVLVDDGSQSPEALGYLNKLKGEFEQRGWHLLRQENRYPGAARNRGARHARGDYLLFMDDDNVAKPNELEVLVRAMETSGAAIMVPVVDRFIGDQVPTVALNQWIPLGGSIAAGVCRNTYGDTNALWRRDVFEALSGFTEEYAVGNEDWELLANAALSGYESYVVPEPLLWYRVSPGGIQVGADEVYSARSVRPYMHRDPSGFGLLLAYALNAYLEAQATELARQGFWVRKIAKLRMYTRSMWELASDAISGWYDTR
ncbi:MAG: glycosyltransferase [Sulfobacillus sp.]